MFSATEKHAISTIKLMLYRRVSLVVGASDLRGTDIITKTPEQDFPSLLSILLRQSLQRKKDGDTRCRTMGLPSTCPPLHKLKMSEYMKTKGWLFVYSHYLVFDYWKRSWAGGEECTEVRVSTLPSTGSCSFQQNSQ